MDERRHFNSEKEAVDWARQISKKIEEDGAQPEVAKDKLELARAYQTLKERLSAHGKTPEEAVTHYLGFLGNEIIRQAKPVLKVQIEKWETEKLASKIRPLSDRTRTELQQYVRYMIKMWGQRKAEEITQKVVTDALNNIRRVGNNTRRKYLRYIRMFFIWLKDRREIIENPTDGIRIRIEPFEAAFYTPKQTKALLRYVLKNEKDLIGYYGLLTFAGLRPSEGARVQWQDISFETGELYVRRGKKEARRFILHETALAWMRFHRKNTGEGVPFVELKNLPGREKAVRLAVMKGKWIQDGLRHGMASYYNGLVNDVYKVAHVLGDNIQTVKRHYMRAVPVKDCQVFWGLVPELVSKRMEVVHVESPTTLSEIRKSGIKDFRPMLLTF
jgi:integrase